MTEILELPGVVPGEPAAAESAGEGSSAAATVHVIGLDPSLTGTGIADGLATWVIGSSRTAKKEEQPTLLQRGDRIRTLAKQVLALIPGDTRLVLIEGDAPHQVMGHKHDRAGLWWLLVSNLQSAGIEVVEISPSQLKKYATGNGNANKAAVIDATARRYPEIETGANDNRCDAHWLAAIGIDLLTGVHRVPEGSHRAALKNVRWPS